jgi:polar amino acid transport system substrate-binding protein
VGRWSALVRLSCLLVAAAAAPRASASHFRCVSLDYPPLIQQEAGGPVHGLAVDLVGAVFARMGHTVSVEIYPWARALALVRQGQRDCVFTIFHTAEREGFLDFSRESILPQIIYFYGQRSGATAFNGDLAALAGSRVGTVLSVNYGARFDTARAALAVREVATLEQNFRKLALGRLDLVPSNLYTASYTLRQMGAGAADIVQLPLALENVASHIAFAKSLRLTALRDQFDREFKAYLAGGAYRKLLDQHRIEMTPELGRFIDGR